MRATLPEKIEILAAGWLASGEADSLRAINEGLCADFANALHSGMRSLTIYGVYDPEDLLRLPGETSSQFQRLVFDDLIGHTAIFFEGRFYDAEAPHGVSSFEDLPICVRAATY